MSTALGVPPGRAGRLWLERRLAVAGRAADLLDRKLRLLAVELARLRAQERRTGQEWETSCRRAERWLLRAVLLGGERAAEPTADVPDAQVTISYTVTMGARHPAAARCVTGQPANWEGPAVAEARRAYAAALDAAVRHAAASAALAVLEEETTATRYRLRAVRDRWIPRLTEALAQAKLALEEQERADAARLRRAAQRAAGRSGEAHALT